MAKPLCYSKITVIAARCRARKPQIIKYMDMAVKSAAPVIGLNDRAAPHSRGRESLAVRADIVFAQRAQLGGDSAVSAIMGHCAGGRAVYYRRLYDFIIMVKNILYMFGHPA